MGLQLDKQGRHQTCTINGLETVSTRRIRVQGHLTVVLDLDGTLVSSYTPARAPRLPAGMNTYIVGKGARMNPNGVFVVERPGLTHFFQQLSSFAGARRHV